MSKARHSTLHYLETPKTLGGLTWLLGAMDYSFDNILLLGKAQLTFEGRSLEVDFLDGDRSAILHILERQAFSVEKFNIHVPINIMSYKFVILTVLNI